MNNLIYGIRRVNSEKDVDFLDELEVFLFNPEHDKGAYERRDRYRESIYSMVVYNIISGLDEITCESISETCEAIDIVFWRPLEDEFYEEYILMTLRKYIKEYLVNGIVLCHDYYAVSIYCSCYINYILKILKALSKGYDDFNGKEILEVYKNTLEYLNLNYSPQCGNCG